MSVPLLMVAVSLLLWPGRRPRIEGLGVRTSRFGSNVEVQTLVVFLVLGAAVIWFGGSWTAGAAVIASVTVVRRRRVGRVRRAKEEEIGYLTTGLDVLIGELRVGGHPVTACGVAAAESAGIAASALAGASARARLGGTAAEGIPRENSVIAAELGRLAQAWRVADTHGLALAELLDANREDLLGRRRFRRRTEAALAGAKATAVVLAGLPALGVVLGQLMGADPLRILLGGGLGGILLVLGTTLACTGILWTDAITDRVTS